MSSDILNKYPSPNTRKVTLTTKTMWSFWDFSIATDRVFISIAPQTLEIVTPLYSFVTIFTENQARLAQCRFSEGGDDFGMTFRIKKKDRGMPRPALCLCSSTSSDVARTPSPPEGANWRRRNSRNKKLEIRKHFFGVYLETISYLYHCDTFGDCSVQRFCP